MNIKNNQKGFVAQGMIVIVAIAVAAGVAYYFGTKNVVAPKGNDVVVNATSTVTDAKCANGATNYPHCNADLLNISELKSLNGITNSGSSFTIKYPKGYVFFKYSCNVNGVAFWPESQPRVIPTGSTCPQEIINGAPIIVTTETMPQLTVVDQNFKEDAKNFTVTVSTVSQPSITVLSPNGGEILNIESSDINAVIPIRLSLRNTQGISAFLVDVSGKVVSAFATDNRDNGTVIQFNVNQQKTSDTIKSGQYKIKVCDYTNSNCDFSDSYFTIIQSATMPSIVVLSPNGNENWVKGSTKTIRWSNPSTQTVSGAGGPQDEIAIFINSQPTDTAPLLKTIVTGLNKNATSYDWNVGSNVENAVLNGSYYIKVCRKTFTCDWSNAAFFINN